MKRSTKVLLAVPLAIVALVALFAAAGIASRYLARVTGPADVATGSSLSTSSTGTAEAAPATAGKSAASDGGAAGSSGASQYAAAVSPASAPSAHYLVRTGDLAILVGRGTLLSTVDRIRAMTAAMDGYVMSSAFGSNAGVSAQPEPQPLDAPAGGGTTGDVATQFSAGTPYATITVRVPERLFDVAARRFSTLGTVQSVSTTSEDVTSQYVDLQARLRHFRAVDRRLVGFLAQTSNVNQMLTVQDRIDQVQLSIEELTAQMKSLRETTTYGTLSVYVSERDSTQPAAIHSSDTFGGTFWNSVRLLGHGARVTGLVLTALAPFLVVFGGIGVVVWLVVRKLRRGRRQAAQPGLPA